MYWSDEMIREIIALDLAHIADDVQDIANIGSRKVMAKLMDVLDEVLEMTSCLRAQAEVESFVEYTDIEN